jgi:hypothetical protein
VPGVKARRRAADLFLGPPGPRFSMLAFSPLPQRTPRRLLGGCALALLALAPSAQAATRYAAPAGTGSACAATAPCAVAEAVSGAAGGDEVVLAGGDYDVAATLKATVSLTIQGVAGQPRPRLIGATSLTTDTLHLSAGGTARHLEIQGRGSSGAALRLRGAVGEDLVLLSTSETGAAAILKASPGGTLLRDTLAVCRACGDGALAFKDDQNQDHGTATAAAVTAVSAGSSAAVHSTVQDGTVTLVDVTASGDDADVTGLADSPVRVSYSAFRRAASRGLSDGDGNVGPATFVDAAGGDYHQAAGSVTLDAGVADPRAGAVDLDGAPRVAGSAPDIGAYEGVGVAAPTATTLSSPLGGAGAAGDPLHGSLAPAGTPVLHRAVAVAPASGKVLVRLPDSARAVALADATKLPLGSEIDARQGVVRLTSAVSAGASQTGLFSGGRFRVRQGPGRRPFTQLVLSGGDFSPCGRGTAAARAARKGPSRRLWGRDNGGRFQTVGRSASATVRGTRWLTEDSCAGTRVTVAQGAVTVRPRHGGRAVTVRAGHSRLVRAPR